MDKAAAAAYVKNTVAGSTVVVFSKSYCPYCHKAKAALRSVLGNIKFSTIELDEMPADCDIIQNALQDVTGGRSVPRVFIGGKFIGGGDDTARMASNGELKTLLTAAGVVTQEL